MNTKIELCPKCRKYEDVCQCPKAQPQLPASTGSAPSKPFDPRPDSERKWLRAQPRKEPVVSISEDGEEIALLMLYHGAQENAHSQFYEVGLILSNAIWGTFPMDVPQYVRLKEQNDY